MSSRIVTLTPVLNGGLQTNYTNVSTSHTIGSDEFIIFCDTTVGPIALTLAPATGINIVYIIDSGGNSSANNITISPNTGLINGQSTCTISTNYTSLTIISNGTNYFII